MTKDPFSLREEEIFHTLKALSGCDFAIIGGYAVNAYALPRFSVDCDIVIRNENELKKIGKILQKIGYEKKNLPENVQYSGSFARYEKRLHNSFAVSMDILVHKVTDRMTGVKFEAAWIFENSRIRVLKGKTITEDLKARIISIDALLVMKIISGRSTDIRDVFMMMPNAQDIEQIKSEIILRSNIKERIARIIAKVTSKQFKDGLSGVYGYIDQKAFEKHKKAILFLMK